MNEHAAILAHKFTFEILDYLIHHPGAKDTLTGIVEWWLLEQKIRREAGKVRETLAELVALDLVLQQEINGQVYFCINREKEQEIRALLREWLDTPETPTP